MKKQLLILLSFLCFAICIHAQDNADARQVAEQSLSKSKDIISTAQKEDDAEKKSNWKCVCAEAAMHECQSACKITICKVREILTKLKAREHSLVNYAAT